MQCACSRLASVACSTLHYFSTLSHKQYDFGEKKFTAHKMCVLIFSTSLPETHFILRGTERDMIKNVYWSSCKVTLVIVVLFQ